MSLLQEMEKHGLADCEFNRQLLKGGSMTINIEDEAIQAKAEVFVEKNGLQADLSDISEDMYEEILKMFEDKLMEFGIERKGYFDNWKLTCDVSFKEAV